MHFLTLKCFNRVISSVGQSIPFTSGRPSVQIGYRPLDRKNIESVIGEKQKYQNKKLHP